MPRTELLQHIAAIVFAFPAFVFAAWWLAEGSFPDLTVDMERAGRMAWGNPVAQFIIGGGF